MTSEEMVATLVETESRSKSNTKRLDKMEQRQDEIDELELRIATPVDEEFIERIARERGFRKPNEIIFKYDIGE